MHELTIWVQGLKGQPAFRRVNNRSTEEVRSFAKACAVFVLKEKQQSKDMRVTLLKRIRVVVEIKHFDEPTKFYLEHLAFDENANLLGSWREARLIPAA